jgi:ABC-type branched-subunit amino acid transport system ATPase component
MTAEPGSVASPVLATTGLTVELGGRGVLRNVTTSLAGDIVSGVIGPNGAGKTTLLNAVSGLVSVSHGEILLHSSAVTGRSSHKMAELGLGRSFQGAQLVQELSAVENVMIGDHLQNRSSLPGAMVRSARARRHEREGRDRARAALQLVGAERAADRQIKELPFGQRKRVDIARAIVANPTCLLLDEPLAGLSDAEKHEVADIVQKLTARGGLSIVLVEHDMRFVNQLCSYVVVLDAGEVLASGVPQEVMARPDVIEAYVGKRREGGP